MKKINWNSVKKLLLSKCKSELNCLLLISKINLYYIKTLLFVLNISKYILKFRIERFKVPKMSIRIIVVIAKKKIKE